MVSRVTARDRQLGPADPTSQISTLRGYSDNLSKRPHVAGWQHFDGRTTPPFTSFTPQQVTQVQTTQKLQI